MDDPWTIAVLIGGVVALPLYYASETRRPDQTFSERLVEIATSISRGGDAMSRMGCALTATVTLPIIGYLIAGFIGAAVGLLIGLMIIGATSRD